jgi:hypothetical protein
MPVQEKHREEEEDNQYPNGAIAKVKQHDILHHLTFCERLLAVQPE